MANSTPQISFTWDVPCRSPDLIRAPVYCISKMPRVIRHFENLLWIICMQRAILDLKEAMDVQTTHLTHESIEAPMDPYT
jgi:hypothetical protein